MTQDSDGERPQKTVAELLAQHGAQTGGSRRRRRRADDEDEAPETPERPPRDIGDTAPQAIIDRVTGDAPPARRNGAPRRQPGSHQESGALPRPPQQDSQALPRPPQPPPPLQQDSQALPRPVPPPPQNSGALPRPPAPQQNSQALPRPVQPPDNAPPRAPRRGAAPAGETPGEPTRRVPVRPRRGGTPPPAVPVPPPPAPGELAARLDGLDEPPVDAEPGPPPTGGYPVPPPPSGRVPRRRSGPVRRPAPPKPEEHTEQIPVIRDDTTDPANAAHPAEPDDGPGYASGYNSGYASGYNSGFAPKPPLVDTEPGLDEPPAGLAGWRERRQRPAEPQLEDTQAAMMSLEDLEADEYDPADDPRSGFGNRFTTGDFEAVQQPVAGELGGNAYGSTEYEDDYDAPARGYDTDDDYEDDVDDTADADDRYDAEPVEEASPGRQWLMMAAQLALGVIGGAGVWLGFNWLWGQIPAAALVAALAVIIGLVWIVRKIRRADDIQTLVLAVLVGLVVTVSPAALLLLSK